MTAEKEDHDYSPSYQDEYQRLWHRAEALAERRGEALRKIRDWIGSGEGSEAEAAEALDAALAEDVKNNH